MRFVLLLVAAVIAVVAGVAALKITGGGKDEPKPVVANAAVQKPANVSTVEVLVAREQIDVGSIIKEEMLAKQPWPSHLVLESFVVAGSNEGNVVGRVARTTFMPQEPLLKTRLSNPNDPSFLAATLPEGMRAVTIGTDTVAGVAGYIFPGDRVDILMTHNVPADEFNRTKTDDKKKMNTKPAFTEVLLSNIRVLGVNLRPKAAGEDTKSNAAPSSLTLAVPEGAVQQLRLAEKLGTLSLALRSIKDMEKYDALPPTSLENLTRVSLSRAGMGGVRLVRGVDTDSKAGSPVQRSMRDVTSTMEGQAPATEGAPSDGMQSQQ